MNELKIVATIVVKEEYKDELLVALKKVVDETRKEPGNISYELHEDTTNLLKYVILEVWKSAEVIDLHNESIHFGEFKKAIDGKIDSLTIDVIRKVY